jgi:DNA repair protein RadC
MTIKDLSKTRQPRERLVSFGAENLTDGELLAIILTSGTKKKNVLKLAKEILKKFPLRTLRTFELSELAQIDGIGKVKAGKILVSLELGRRSLGTKSHQQLLIPEDVVKEVKDITNKSQEHLLALYLNARHELIEKQTICIGTINQVIIEPRDIFSYALLLPSPLIILVHNHPSKDPLPSNPDIAFTKRIVDAGKLLGIQIVDHIIVTEKDYCSFRERKLI